MLAVSIALQADEKKLRKLLPPERKREVGENPKKRDENDRGNPEFLLPCAERLGIDAGDRAAEDDQPNDRKAQPHLAVELRGMEAESAENIAHGNDGIGGARGVFPEKNHATSKA